MPSMISNCHVAMDAIELQRSGEFSVGAFAENSIGIDMGDHEPASVRTSDSDGCGYNGRHRWRRN